ncbi:hypothetical protein BROUX41_001092 [Berkeleyomyces rouxiae]|uniref:uncharacterized protein n=1 Tax=Berkeleyomyces rouxiae TaxID=2035830 RepID=UPI003B7F3630
MDTQLLSPPDTSKAPSLDNIRMDSGALELGPVISYDDVRYTFSTSIMIPALPQIMLEFAVSRVTAPLTLTIYTIGLAFGPLFIASFSELFGRRWIYVTTSGAFVIFTGCCTAAPNFASLLVLRFCTGFSGSAVLAIGAGTIADVWGLSTSGAYAGLLFILGPFLGPTLGPLAGAYVMGSHSDWRWTLYTALILGSVLFVATVLMSETSKNWILRNDPAYQNKIDLSAENIGALLRKALLKPTRMLFTDSVVSVLAFYSAYVYALVFSYFASTSYILQRFYSFTLKEVGLSFLSVIIGYLLATIMFGVFTRIGERKATQESVSMHNEHRLMSACVGSLLLPAGLFWYAWEAHAGGRWAALVAAGIVFGCGAFSIFLSIIIYQVEFFGADSGASAIAANGMLSYTMGAVFPLFTVQMYQKLGVHWAGSTFAFLAVAMIPIPFILFKFGPRLRQRSKFTPDVFEK